MRIMFFYLACFIVSSWTFLPGSSSIFRSLILSGFKKLIKLISSSLKSSGNLWFSDDFKVIEVD